jgi:hypothetical protein
MALGRQIALLSALAAALVALAGCGGDDSTSAGIPVESGDAINAKLDQIQERVAEQDCFGEGSAQSALEALQGDVSGGLLADEDEGFVSDLSEMLDQLGQQIQDQCEQKDQTTSSTEPTTTTTTTTTEPTTTEETTSTKDHETSTPTEDTTEQPPDNSGNNGGGPPPTTPGGGGTPPGQGGTPPGQSGGFSPGRKPAKEGKPKKPDKPDHGKPKDEKKQ